LHKHMRTHGSEGATELGRDGPRPVGPSRSTWPTSRVGSAPFRCTLRIFNPKSVEAPPFVEERAIRTVRTSTS
jgi:hypothetical protein